MILNGVGWHYITVTKPSALLKGITSKLNGDSYCLNCFYSIRIDEKGLNNIKLGSETKVFVVLETHLLKKTCQESTHRLLFMNIFNLRLKKTSTCKNNPGKQSATKLGKHISCGY